MRQYDQGFLQGMKKKLQVDLIGVASADNPKLKDKRPFFCPP